MSKKISIYILLLAVTCLSIYVGYALDVQNPIDVINLTVTNGSYGTQNLEVHETTLKLDNEQTGSGYKGEISLTVEPGYYIKNVEALFQGDPLQLGFEAGAEQGNHFRPQPYSPLQDLYQFIIPNSASTEHKIDVNIEYAEKTPFNITYKAYKGTGDLENPANYYDEVMLVEGYKDGDLVLPNALTNNGGALLFKFTDEAYAEYKTYIIPESGNRWFRPEAVVDGKNYLDGSCNDSTKTCQVMVDKDFKNLSYGKIELAYTKMNVYTPDYVGFSVETDVNNFNDIIAETGSSTIGFTNSKLDATAEIFYGTRQLRLTKKEPSQIIKTGTTNGCPTTRTFNNVTGSGYGYNVSYENGIATITINTFYQDELVIDLNILNNSENILGNTVHFTLNRFAFAGNGGQLLEVDELGRNCRETSNHNTCEERVYYSTQYRGVLNFMYINENQAQTTLNDNYVVTDMTNDSLTLENEDHWEAYLRNADFNPHAIALFYDENDMIVGHKDFDLNNEIDMEGFVSKNVFDSKFSSMQLNIQSMDRDYVHFDNAHPTRISNLKYFGPYTEETVMHDIVLIPKDEAQAQGIKKIGLFLVNGETTSTDVPALTYGLGQGRIMEIFEENNPEEQGGGE